MNITAPPSGLHPEDYDRIEAAVMETVRGRWFLLEYTRRQRAQETERLVQAIDRLERYVSSHQSEPARSVEDEIEGRGAAIDPESARQVAAKAKRFASALRDRGLDEDLCAEADDLANAFGELTGAVDQPIISGLPALIETRIEDLQKLQDEPSLEGEEQSFAIDPQVNEEHLDDRVVEAEILDAEIVEARAQDWSEPEIFAPSDIVSADPRLVALSRIDNLSLREKLAVFG